MPKSGTGYKALYMRQRKNLMQKARYYDIKLPHIATARELDRKIQKSDIKTLSNLEKSYINPIRVSRAATRNEIRIESQKLQNLTNEQIAKKYSSRFTKVLPKHDGTSVLIDKFTNEELGYSGYISREELGEYLRSKYGKTAYTIPGARQGNPVEDVMILEAFKTEIQSRINAAAHDMATGQHGSAAGIEKIQKLLDNFGKQDWENAYFKYENYVDEIRNYLDEALYYSEDEQSHLRAINILEDLLGADKMDIDFDAADYSEGLDDFSDYQFGRPYKFTKKPKTEQEVVVQPTEDITENTSDISRRFDRASDIMSKTTNVLSHMSDTIEYENGQYDTYEWIPEYHKLIQYTDLVETIIVKSRYSEGINSTQLNYEAPIPYDAMKLENHTIDEQHSLGLDLMNVNNIDNLLDDYERVYNNIFTPTGKIKKQFLKRNK